MGKGSALISGLALGASFMVEIDRNFDEFSHAGYSKISWKQLCSIYGVDSDKSLLLKGDIPEVSFRGVTFYLVSLIDVIEHVPDPKCFINYSIDQISDNGFLIIDTCPLYYSPMGHHLFQYDDRTSGPWAHLKSDFEQTLIKKNVDGWSIERFHELNICKYEDIKQAVLERKITLIIDPCDVDNNLIGLYEKNKASIDPNGTYGSELLCREWFLIVGQKVKSLLL